MEFNRLESEKDKDTEKENKNIKKSLSAILVSFVLGCFAYFLFAGPGFYIMLLISAGIFSVFLGQIGNKAAIIPIAVCVFGLSLASRYTVKFSLYFAAFVVMLALTGIICTEKKKSFLKYSVMSGFVILIFFAFFWCYHTFKVYGSVIDGTVIYAEKIFNDTVAMLKETAEIYSEEYAGVFDFSVIDIEKTLKQEIILLPGLISVFFLISGKIYALISYLMLSFFRMKKHYYPDGISFFTDRPAVIFFGITSVLLLIVSSFENTDVFCFTCQNIAAALFLPAVIDGGARLIYNMRHPIIIIAGDRTVLKRPVFFLIITVISLFISIILAFGLLSLYSVVSAVKEIIGEARKKKKNGNRD